MCGKNTGGFEKKPVKCQMCGKVFTIEFLPPGIDEDVEYCPYCGRTIYASNDLPDDELLAQIEEKEKAN